jgi:hypothetical protein
MDRSALEPLTLFFVVVRVCVCVCVCVVLVELRAYLEPLHKPFFVMGFFEIGPVCPGWL